MQYRQLPHLPQRQLSCHESQNPGSAYCIFDTWAQGIGRDPPYLARGPASSSKFMPVFGSARYTAFYEDVRTPGKLAQYGLWSGQHLMLAGEREAGRWRIIPCQRHLRINIYAAAATMDPHVNSEEKNTATIPEPPRLATLKNADPRLIQTSQNLLQLTGWVLWSRELHSGFSPPIPGGPGVCSQPLEANMHGPCSTGGINSRLAKAFRLTPSHQPDLLHLLRHLSLRACGNRTIQSLGKRNEKTNFQSTGQTLSN